MSKPSFAPANSPSGDCAHAARRAEIDVAVQFAHDQDVETRDDFFLQRRSAGELRIADRRTEVREQLQVLAQTENRLLRTQRAFELVVLPVADGAEQDRVGFFRERQRRIGQRMALRFVARAANRRFFEFELFAEHVQDLDGFLDDFRTDAVARQHCDLHAISLTISRAVSANQCAEQAMRHLARRCGRFSHGCFAIRSASNWRILSGVTQREADVVEAVQQAVLAERRDFERIFGAAVDVRTTCASRSTVSLKPSNAYVSLNR